MPNSKSVNNGSQTPFADLKGDDAIEFVRHLASANKDTKKHLQKFLKDKCRLESDVEDVALAVQSDLEFLDVEDVWDQAGKTRYGYQDPSDVAADMFDAAIAPYEEQFEKCIEVGSLSSARLTGMGILLGIYRFEHDSVTEFSDWVADVPLDRFLEIVERIKTMSEDKNETAELNTFIASICPMWSKSSAEGQ